MKTIPVDAYKVRNSLYVTVGQSVVYFRVGNVYMFDLPQQPLRTPAQASVNVIMREDTGTMEDAAKYEGMESQIERLQTSVSQGWRSSIAIELVPVEVMRVVMIVVRISALTGATAA